MVFCLQRVKCKAFRDDLPLLKQISEKAAEVFVIASTLIFSILLYFVAENWII